jgi:hypothetical protein
MAVSLPAAGALRGEQRRLDRSPPLSVSLLPATPAAALSHHISSATTTDDNVPAIAHHYSPATADLASASAGSDLAATNLHERIREISLFVLTQ